MIEKLLKAYYIKTKSEYPPYTHNLVRLAEKTGLKLTAEKKKQLATITAFNINARYDGYKMSFKHLCTEDYTAKWIRVLKKVRLWIKEMILQ